MKKDELLQVLQDAYESLPASRVVAVFGTYVDLTTCDASPRSSKRAAPRQLLDAVRRFHTDSLAGHCYESFRVTSKNFYDNIVCKPTDPGCQRISRVTRPILGGLRYDYKLDVQVA